jgi:hypothetical protein
VVRETVLGAAASDVPAPWEVETWLCEFVAGCAWPNAGAATRPSMLAIARLKDAFFTSDSSVAVGGDMF